MRLWWGLKIVNSDSGKCLTAVGPWANIEPAPFDAKMKRKSKNTSQKQQAKNGMETFHPAIWILGGGNGQNCQFGSLPTSAATQPDHNCFCVLARWRCLNFGKSVPFDEFA